MNVKIKNIEQTYLSVNGVSMAYADLKILDNLSMKLKKGEIGCLLGSSGCGKTTLLRSIAGFEKPQQGTISLNDQTLISDGQFIPPEKRGIGLVFQDFALFPHLTIEANISFGLSSLNRSERKQRVNEMLQLIGLEETRQRYPHQLSGGQQQRIALARALAPKPQLLLLDEPFSSLDVELREQLAIDIRNILKQLHISAIMVTHDQNEAFMVADKIGLMRNGQIVQWSTPYDLYHKPQNDYVAGFVGKGSIIPGIIIDDGTVETVLGTLKGHFDMPPYCKTEACHEYMDNIDSYDKHIGEGIRTIESAIDFSIPEPCKKKGCEVSLLIRPDDVIHDDDSSLALEITSKVFKGDEFLYQLKIDDEHHLLCNVPSHHNHALNSKLGIKMDVEHIILLKKQT
ncbi:MAG: ABC transporter ATP-binding protein [Gammaproteobacteria bacterium]|nr:ABC transporter ATP-binding protein [Gammaproteobacteria bacterium]